MSVHRYSQTLDSPRSCVRISVIIMNNHLRLNDVITHWVVEVRSSRLAQGRPFILDPQLVFGSSCAL